MKCVTLGRKQKNRQITRRLHQRDNQRIRAETDRKPTRAALYIQLPMLDTPALLSKSPRTL